jgi:hypothetical protein
VNKKQKNLLLITIVLFGLTVLIVPQELRMLLAGGDMPAPQARFGGYTFIWSVYNEISLKHLFVEWMGVLVCFAGLFYYLKE